MWGIHRSPVNSPRKGPVTRKMLPFDDVILRCLETHRYLHFMEALALGVLVYFHFRYFFLIEFHRTTSWFSFLSTAHSRQPTNCLVTGWRHEMETLSALLTLCEGIPPVTGRLASQRPMTLFGVFFDVRFNNLLNKQSCSRYFETTWRSVDVTLMHAT